MAASFGSKPGSDKTVCEHPSFDQRAVLRALQIG
jgi:hypothetical protein